MKVKVLLFKELIRGLSPEALADFRLPLEACVELETGDIWDHLHPEVVKVLRGMAESLLGEFSRLLLRGLGSDAAAGDLKARNPSLGVSSSESVKIMMDTLKGMEERIVARNRALERLIETEDT